MAPPSELLYGIPQGEVILKSAIIAALDDVRANPWLLEYIFASLTTDPVVKQEHGKLEIDAAKQWFTSTRVLVRMDTSMDEPVLPCITISIGNSSESEVTLADLHYDTVATTDVAETCIKALTPSFAVDSYSPSTGIVSIPESVAATFVLAPGMVLVDGVGAKHTILEVLSAKTFRIGLGVQNDLNRCVIRGSMPDSFVTLESVEYRENYSINVHASEVFQSQWLTSIVKFCLLRYKQRLLEARGLERTTFGAMGPIQNTALGAQMAFTQSISFTAYARYSWPKDFTRGITSVATVTGITTAGADCEVDIGSGFGWDSVDVEGQMETSLIEVVPATGQNTLASNLYRAQDVIIQRIVGLSAGNVQDALEEIVATVDDLEQETLSLRSDVSTLQSGFGGLQSDISDVASALSLHELSTVAHGALGAVVGTDNVQTLSNKTLASPFVSGALMPVTAGMQDLGSAAMPWGRAYLKGAVGLRALEIDQGNISSVQGILIRNAGVGPTGIAILDAQGGSLGMGRGFGAPNYFSSTNRSIEIYSDGAAYDPNPHGVSITNRGNSGKARNAVRISGAIDQTGSLTQWFTQHTDASPVATLHSDGTFETTAGFKASGASGPGLELTTGKYILFGDGTTLSSASILSGVATLTGTETLSNKTLASPLVSGALMPVTAGMQDFGSESTPWGKGYFSAPVGEDAVTIPGGSRFRYGAHSGAYFYGFSTNTNPLLMFAGGIQVNSGLFINGGLRRTMTSTPTPGNTTLHSHFSGRAAVAAGESSMTIYSNQVTGTAANQSTTMIIQPRQFDPTVTKWRTEITAPFTMTVYLDAPCTNDFWFDFVILS